MGRKVEKAEKAEKETKPKKTTKAKKEKDPNAPKKPTTAYFAFMKERRPGVVEENPEIKNVAEISKILGSEWKELTEEDKVQYNETAALDKKRYEKEKAAYESGSTAKPKAKGKKAKEEEEEEEDEESSD
eukprot:Platyproteum_vivax@DN4355_c0_g1_i3.p1